MKPAAATDLPDVADIYCAQARIRHLVHATPVLNDPLLDEALGCKVYCKCENFQRTGAFKFRGACNAIACLQEQELAGEVATHSSGNHGAALALAARLAGRTAHVVMPENSSPMKIDAVKSYGGQVHFCSPTNEARAAELQKLVAEGMIPVHPYDDPRIIAGQGTAALELEQAVPTLEQVVTPLGGGGLVSGTAIATESWGVSVFAVEPEGAADTVASLKRGEVISEFSPDTIADGLRAIVGMRNFQVIRDRVTGVLTVSDDEMRLAMVLFWQKMKILIEPSSATVIAALQKYPETFAGHKVGVVISGGNIHPAEWLRLTGKLSD
ncbi:MAG: threonine/serine dehydratase [Xanthomonadales bacterium]|nr:threonine/serine dehydratase [Gammaproteobacteria bacterium]MBT8055093.1 threonine/serine dehydratase [Gammaproteobacteria bacterium]NND58246.1 threonine/serine dehydratase [Xanthomonadales bacterium]NNK51687.1 threonine/serine dehydratase [Xanthomonadales bacterium]